MIAKEKSLKTINKIGFWTKFINVFKKIFSKEKNGECITLNNNNVGNMSNEDVFARFSQQQDPDMEMLLNIQKELEKIGINKENVFELTKNLSEGQKQKLEKLYASQISELKTNIEKYRNRIVKIKQKIES